MITRITKIGSVGGEDGKIERIERRVRVHPYRLICYTFGINNNNEKGGRGVLRPAWVIAERHH
jgi:hypothetical protein